MVLVKCVESITANNLPKVFCCSPYDLMMVYLIGNRDLAPHAENNATVYKAKMIRQSSDS